MSSIGTVLGAHNEAYCKETNGLIKKWETANKWNHISGAVAVVRDEHTELPFYGFKDIDVGDNSVVFSTSTESTQYGKFLMEIKLYPESEYLHLKYYYPDYQPSPVGVTIMIMGMGDDEESEDSAKGSKKFKKIKEYHKVERERGEFYWFV
jgi:hypothetical protein